MTTDRQNAWEIAMGMRDYAGSPAQSDDFRMSHSEMVKRLQAAMTQVANLKTTKRGDIEKSIIYHNIANVLTELQRYK